MISGMLGQGIPGSTNCSSQVLDSFGSAGVLQLLPAFGAQSVLRGSDTGIPAGAVPFHVFFGWHSAGYAGEVGPREVRKLPRWLWRSRSL